MSEWEVSVHVHFKERAILHLIVEAGSAFDADILAEERAREIYGDDLLYVDTTGAVKTGAAP